MKPPTTNLTTAVETLLKGELDELLGRNASAIAQQLAEAPEGQLSVGVSFKLKLAAKGVGAKGTMKFAKKFSDASESSVALEDPNQLPLEGIAPQSEIANRPS